MPLMKEEKPGMKMSQYKEMVWKAWQKAPENPVGSEAMRVLLNLMMYTESSEEAEREESGEGDGLGGLVGSVKSTLCRSSKG